MSNLIHKNEKGMVLPLGLMFLAIIAILGTTAVIVTTTDLKIGSNYRASEQAFCAAEAGTEEARARLGDIGQTGTPDKDWRRFIGDAASATSIFGYDSTDSDHNLSASLQSNLDYTVMIRHKTEADIDNDLNSDGDKNDVILWGDSDGDYAYEINLTTGKPIEIITSQGTDSGANKIVTIETRYEPAFFDPPAALYVNGNLDKSGAAGSAKGACPGCSPACTTMPDIVTTTNAGECPPKNCEASNWPAGTSTPPNLVDDEADIYPVATVISQLSPKAENTIVPGSYNDPTGWGSAGSPKISYCDGNLTVNGLTGYGILVVDGDFEAKGTVSWEGIIIVSGMTVLKGGGNLTITGALISDAITTIDGTPKIQYDCNVINNLDDTFSNYAVYGWKDFQ
jgi:hypothetical protein